MRAAQRPELALVTPALATANNGNWRTAERWAACLAHDFQVRVMAQWAHGNEAVMVALHARRSAASVAAWRASGPQRPLVVVLTGTDLYRDIHTDAQAQQVLAWADRLVVLNELGVQALPPALRSKAVVCLQSSPAWAARPPPRRHLRALMVGHLRDEKGPDTYFAAARALAHRTDIHLDHVGLALDPVWAAQAQALAAEPAHYRWLGGQTHVQTRRRIQAASVLVHPSRMEGGAQAVIEALVSGTPVLASRIDGNVGLLGAGYPGCFEPGDAAALAYLLQRCRDDARFLPMLRQACARRAPLFEPARECATLRAVLQGVMPGRPRPR